MSKNTDVKTMEQSNSKPKAYVTITYAGDAEVCKKIMKATTDIILANEQHIDNYEWKYEYFK